MLRVEENVWWSRFQGGLGTKLHLRFYCLGISFEGHMQLAYDFTLNMATVCRID